MKTMIDDPRWKEAEKLYDAEKWADALSLLNALAELEAENSRLRKELAEARLECEIIKKAMAYYAKESLPSTRR